MTFDGRLANIRAAVVRGLYCPFSQHLIKRLCMKSRWVVKGSLILFLVSLVPR